MIHKNDLEIIALWAEMPIDTPELDMARNTNRPMYKPTGKWYVIKSKWKLVNWWRELTGTEKKEQEYLYKWEI